MPGQGRDALPHVEVPERAQDQGIVCFAPDPMSLAPPLREPALARLQPFPLIAPRSHGLNRAPVLDQALWRRPWLCPSIQAAVNRIAAAGTARRDLDCWNWPSMAKTSFRRRPTSVQDGPAW